MATLKLIGNFSVSEEIALVFASAQHTPNILNANAVLDLTIDRGDGKGDISYTLSSQNVSTTSSALRIVLPVHADYQGTSVSKQWTTITISGGWKQSSSDSNGYLAMPRQTAVRYSDNNFLNDAKGSLTLSHSGQDLIFKFDGDYIGLRSSEDIKLAKWKAYTISNISAYNFRLDEGSLLDAVINESELQSKGKTGRIKYYYDIDGTTYSDEFEIVNSLDSSVTPTGIDRSSMVTQKYRISPWGYQDFTSQGTNYTPANKTTLRQIIAGEGFELTGKGDFANYTNLVKLNNENGYTQTFSGAMDHTFAGCTSLVQSTLISNLNFNNITKLIGFMSGCSSYTYFFEIGNITSNTTDLTACFEYSSIIAGIFKNWNVSSVTSLESMFEGTSFNRPVFGAWDTSNVVSFKNMFKNNSSFNQYIGNLSTSSATTLEGMFFNASSFNTKVGTFDTSKVTSLKNTFRGASSFNRPTLKWVTNSVTNMSGMFCGASSFNQLLWPKPGTNRWNTSNVSNMASMFKRSGFNKPLKHLNVSNLENASHMFEDNTIFNQDVNNWEIGRIESFGDMFKGSSFNQPLWKWSKKFGENHPGDESIDFEGMFQESAFNYPVKDWEVSRAESIRNMFKDNTGFNKQLFPGWKLRGAKCKNVANFLSGATALSDSVNLASTPDSIKNALKTFGNTIKNSSGFSLLFGLEDSPFPDEFKHDVFKTYRATWESENLVVPEGGSDESSPESSDPCVNSTFDNWISFEPEVTINENGSAGRLDFYNLTADSSQAPDSCVGAGTMYAFIVKRGYSSDSLAVDATLYSNTYLDSNVYGWMACTLRNSVGGSVIASNFFTHPSYTNTWTSLSIDATTPVNAYSYIGWTVNSNVSQNFSSWLGSDDIDIIFQSVGIDYTADVPEVVMFNDSVQATAAIF